MKFTEKWKRFLTLRRSANAGFTLVELIVVIAILAILAGVAVPAYTGYITKANKQADITLVSEVAQALSLYYYSNPNKNVSGYVCITSEGTVCLFGGSGEAAMDAVFGDDWEKNLSLSYDGWEYSTSMPSAADAAKVAKSSYYKNSTPAELVTSFTGLTDALAGMANTASQDPLVTMKGVVMSEDEYEVMRAQLDTLGVSWSSEADADNTAYTTAVSNLLVQKVSSEIGDNQYGADYDEKASQMSTLAINYALIYGWASADAEGAEILANLNAAVTDPNASSTDVVDAVDSAFAQAGERSSFMTYLDTQNGQGLDDISALSSIMGTVSRWSDGADMTTAGLYSSVSITDAVNNYITAVGTMSGIGDIDASALETALRNGVVVFVSSDGTIGYNISIE